MRNLFLVMGTLVAFVGSLGADTAAVSDAKAELEQKQKERERKRGESTQISVGELEDLRAELRRLQLENANLKGKGAAGPAAAVAKPAPKRYTTIEVGMTRDELMTFVKQRATQYKIGSMQTDAGGVSTEKEEYIESSTSSNDTQTLTDNTQRNATGPVGATPKPTEKALSNDRAVSTDTDQSTNRVTERRRHRDKKERVTIDVIGYKSGVVGTERNSTGSYKKMGKVKAVTGYIIASLTNDVVTGVESKNALK